MIRRNLLKQNVRFSCCCACNQSAHGGRVLTGNGISNSRSRSCKPSSGEHKLQLTERRRITGPANNCLHWVMRNAHKTTKPALRCRMKPTMLSMPVLQHEGRRVLSDGPPLSVVSGGAKRERAAVAAQRWMALATHRNLGGSVLAEEVVPTWYHSYVVPS